MQLFQATQGLPDTTISQCAFCANGDILFISGDSKLYRAAKSGNSYITSLIAADVTKLIRSTVIGVKAYAAVMYKRVGTGTGNTYTMNVGVIDLDTGDEIHTITLTGLHPTYPDSAGFNPDRNTILVNCYPKLIEYSLSDWSEIDSSVASSNLYTHMEYVGGNRFLVSSGTFESTARFFQLNVSSKYVASSIASAPNLYPVAYGSNYYHAYYTTGSYLGKDTYSIFNTASITVSQSVLSKTVETLKPYSVFFPASLMLGIAGVTYNGYAARLKWPVESQCHRKDGQWYASVLRRSAVQNGYLVVEETLGASTFEQRPVFTMRVNASLVGVFVIDDKTVRVLPNGTVQEENIDDFSTNDIGDQNTASLSFVFGTPIEIATNGVLDFHSYSSYHNKIRLVDVNYSGANGTQEAESFTELSFTDTLYTEISNTVEYTSPITGAITVDFYGDKRLDLWPNRTSTYDSPVPMVCILGGVYNANTGNQIVSMPGTSPTVVAATCPDTGVTLIVPYARSGTIWYTSLPITLDVDGTVLLQAPSNFWSTNTAYLKSYSTYADGCAVRPIGNGSFLILRRMSSYYYGSQYPNQSNIITYNAITGTATYQDFTTNRNDTLNMSSKSMMYVDTTMNTFFGGTLYTTIGIYSVSSNASASLSLPTSLPYVDAAASIVANETAPASVHLNSSIHTLFIQKMNDVEWYMTSNRKTGYAYFAPVSKHNGQYPKTTSMRRLTQDTAMLIESWDGFSKLTPITIYGVDESAPSAPGFVLPILKRLLARIRGWLGGG